MVLGLPSGMYSSKVCSPKGGRISFAAGRWGLYKPSTWTLRTRKRPSLSHAGLDDLSDRRYEATIGDHDEAQVLFDFLGLESDKFDGAFGP